VFPIDLVVDDDLWLEVVVVLANVSTLNNDIKLEYNNCGFWLLSVDNSEGIFVWVLFNIFFFSTIINYFLFWIFCLFFLSLYSKNN